MGNSSTSQRRGRKRESTPEPRKNQKIKIKVKKGDENDMKSSDADPKLDSLSKFLRGTPLSNINNDAGCRCSFSQDSNDDSNSVEDEELTDSEEGGFFMDSDSDSVSEEDDWEDMESWQDADSDGDDDDKDEDDNGDDDNDDGSERPAILDGSDKAEGQQHSSQQASADDLMPLSGLKPSKEDESDSEDDDFYMKPGIMDLLNESDESAISPSDCEADDWMPSSRQMASILFGLTSGEKGDTHLVRKVANILWNKEDLAMSYVPTVESPGVVSFTQFIPTRQPINQKRLDIVRREYLQYKTGAWGWKTKDMDWEKVRGPVAPMVRKADQLLADYIATLNKPGGLEDDDEDNNEGGFGLFGFR